MNEDLRNIESLEIREEDMPAVVSNCYLEILDIDKKIKEAEENCLRAKESANEQILAKTFSQKKAINATQDAVRSLADSQTSITEAQRLLFENQQKMGHAMRYLLALGASSIAMNRAVISELEIKLKKASEGEISRNAREELIGVIKLLKEQESAIVKQERIAAQVNETQKTVEAHSEEIESIHEVDERQDEIDRMHSTLITENALKNNAQDQEILKQSEADARHDVAIEEQSKVDKIHDEKLSKLEKLLYVAIGLASVALILAIVALLGLPLPN